MKIELNLSRGEDVEVRTPQGIVRFSVVAIAAGEVVVSVDSPSAPPPPRNAFPKLGGDFTSLN